VKTRDEKLFVRKHVEDRLRVVTAFSLSSSISKCHSGRCTAITYCVQVSAVIIKRFPPLA
jgi:hypothetical protein